MSISSLISNHLDVYAPGAKPISVSAHARRGVLSVFFYKYIFVIFGYFCKRSAFSFYFLLLTFYFLLSTFNFYLHISKKSSTFAGAIKFNT